MTTLREAAQQALEALRCAAPTGKITLADWLKAESDLRTALAKQRLTDAQQGMERSIESLKAALAQQAEPVADPFNCPKCGRHDYGMHGACPTCDAQQAEPVDTDCHTQGICQRSGYGIGKQAEPVEPVAWVHIDAHNSKVRFLEWTQQPKGYRGDWIKTPLCNCAPPRQTDPQIEDRLARHGIPKP